MCSLGDLTNNTLKGEMLSLYYRRILLPLYTLPEIRNNVRYMIKSLRKGDGFGVESLILFLAVWFWYVTKPSVSLSIKWWEIRLCDLE